MPASEKRRAAGVSRAVSWSWAQQRKSRGGAVEGDRRPSPWRRLGRRRPGSAPAGAPPASTVTPHSSLRRRRSQISSSPATGSSWEVGSSSRTRRGRVTRAAASATRWSSPPERVSTVRVEQVRDGEGEGDLLDRAGAGRGWVAAHLQRQADLGRDRGRDDLGLGVLGDVADGRGQLAGAGGDRVDAGRRDPTLDLAAVEVRARGRRRRAAGSTCRRPSARRGGRTRRGRPRARRRRGRGPARARIGVGEALDRESGRRARRCGELSHGEGRGRRGRRAGERARVAGPAPTSIAG